MPIKLCRRGHPASPLWLCRTSGGLPRSTDLNAAVVRFGFATLRVCELRECSIEAWLRAAPGGLFGVNGELATLREQKFGARS
jgi:hypothetical protein